MARASKSSKKKSKKAEAPKKKSLLRRLIVALVVMGALGVGMGAAALSIVARDLPALKSLEDYKPPQTTQIYDRHGELVARFYTQRRTVVPVERIPPRVKNAFIAAEDAQFYQHEGLDYTAIAAAVFTEIKSKLIGGARRGGSTITQQTAKTFLLTPERTYSRKIKEALLAMRIEEELTKDEILHLYLNQIYFGHGAYGVEEAARTYYGRSVEQLTLGQAATLACIPKSPNRINPYADVKRVAARRAYVLEQMEEHGFITGDERAKAEKEPIRIDFERPRYLDLAPDYAEHIRLLLTEKLGDELVLQGGLKVYTTLDGELQAAAQGAVRAGLEAVDRRQGYRGPLVRLDPDEAKDMRTVLDTLRAERFTVDTAPELADDTKLSGRPVWDLQDVSGKALSKNPTPALDSVRVEKLKKGLVLGAVVKRVDDTGRKTVFDLGTIDGVIPLKNMKWARKFNPVKSTRDPRRPGEVFKPGDIVLVKVTGLNAGKKDRKGRALAPWVDLELMQRPRVQGAFAAVDPHSHHVVAMVGSYDFARSQFNRASQAKRQPGSSFKPFIYALGIEDKKFTPVGHLSEEGSRLITDAPKVYLDPWTGKKWNPKNSGGRYRGDITLRTCLTFSVNTCSISILEKIGVDRVHEVAGQLDLVSDGRAFPKNLTLALGTGEVHPLNLVNAYSVFPNGGTFAKPVFVSKVKDGDGKVLLKHEEDKSVRVFSEATAFVMSDMMKSVVENGTAKGAKALGRPVAGKTGTTNQARSVWFVGFTPNLVAGAYVGFDNNDPLGHREYGGKAALPIWLNFMERAVKEVPEQDFTPPEGVVRRNIDQKTGLLAAADIDEPDADAAPFGGIKDVLESFFGGSGSEEPAALEENELPPSEEGELPPGAYSEVFVEGTEPMKTVEQQAPPPLEFMEGGLGP